MKAILIDSDVLIEVSRARDKTILARWDELGRGDAMIVCLPVNVAELWQGVRPYERQALAALFAVMICIPIDAEIAQRAGDYLNQFAKSHNGELGDALIAATVSIHNVRLWTRNRRHYPMKGLAFYS